MAVVLAPPDSSLVAAAARRRRHRSGQSSTSGQRAACWSFSAISSSAPSARIADAASIAPPSPSS
ncbi:hypothetical protein CK203_066029 [Vitis vinifera]|uniref:Uncharacterized protein n=1 Tax=Vitis vinifera TaxID=29760 RepID=A0A438FP14_VITVI|nr:hypothetical protein CK203_066029 [Vitis vinifera]